MSKKFYDSLPEDLKLVVDVSARKAEAWINVEMDKENKAAMKKLESAGMKINTLSEAAMNGFRKVAMEKVFPEVIEKKLCGPRTKELLDMFVWANK